MKMIVGLGNPGNKYEGTRHNIGFAVVRRVAEKHASGTPKAKFEAEVMEANIAGEKVLLLLPLTYMNRSGFCVSKAKEFFKIETIGVLIVTDDFHLPLGKLRFRPSGSAGGQKGLAHTIQMLGTDQVPRLRLGVGPVPDRWDPADFVLGKFAKDQESTVDQAIKTASQACTDWVEQGIDACMNKYN